jgi:hypothetical protein
MDEMQTLKAIHARVGKLLDEKPYVKGDYRLLDAIYLRKYHGVYLCRIINNDFVVLEFDEIRKLPSMETINRSFRLHQAKGKKPSLRTQEKRINREETIKEFVRGDADGRL